MKTAKDYLQEANEVVKKIDVKEAIENLAEEVDIPNQILRKMSRIYHKQKMSEVAGEIEDIEALMETFTPKLDNNEDG